MESKDHLIMVMYPPSHFQKHVYAHDIPLDSCTLMTQSCLNGKDATLTPHTVNPGGGEASSSTLPTLTLSCDLGRYPLSLLEDCLGGMLACMQQIVIGSSILSKLILELSDDSDPSSHSAHTLESLLNSLALVF